jgi:hypothetical protein
MKRFIALTLWLLTIGGLSRAQTPASSPVRRDTPVAYLGFDRNDYPGDENLGLLRKTFAFAAYWLNYPPGTQANTWVGKRAALQSAGFGFLVVFAGRSYRELNALPNIKAAGTSDARAAVAAARREGFPRGTIIFLDQEEGGRQLAEQKTYIYAFVDGVTSLGFRAGVYCSGIPFREANGTTIVTAADIRSTAGGRNIAFWVSNDACGPSPGCSFVPTPEPAESGVAFASVWQYAQSPRRRQYTAQCRNSYAANGDCYAPGLEPAGIHVDLNAATSADPSHGRTR